MLLIAAIGSMHGADSLGWDVADTLSANIAMGKVPEALSVAAQSQLQIHKYLHPTAVLAAASQASCVIFVDALCSEAHAYGELLTFAAAELKNSTTQISSHVVSLHEAIGLGRQLGMLPPDCRVIGLNAHPFLELPVTDVLRQKLVAAIWSEIASVFHSAAEHYTASQRMLTDP